MEEWSNAAVLKTVEGHTSGGSNPSFSAIKNLDFLVIRWLRFIFFTAHTVGIGIKGSHGFPLFLALYHAPPLYLPATSCKLRGIANKGKLKKHL